LPAPTSTASLITKHHQHRQHRSLYCPPQHHCSRSHLHQNYYLFNQRSLAL
jgi:hypothetical protein